MRSLCWSLVISLLLTGFSGGCTLTAPPEDPAANPAYLAAIVAGDAVLLDEDGAIIHSTDFGDVRCLLWAPDGSKLLIHRNQNKELWIIDADGSNLKRLASGVTIDNYHLLTGYLWHHDSNRIAYALADAHEIQILTLDSNVTFSISLPGPAEGPWWSPSGDGLALTISLDAGDGSSPLGHVMIYDLEGVQLFNRPSAFSPRWLGEILVFGSYSVDPVSGYWFTEDSGAVDSRGENLRWLDPLLPQGLPSGRLVLENGEGIYSQQSLDTSTRRLICSQDVFITYSEYSYPFLYQPAYHADWIATLQLTITSGEEDQFGHWDLKIHDLDYDTSWLVWPQVHTLSGWDFNIPHSWLQTLFWSHDGKWVYVVQGNEEQLDLWRVSAGGQGAPEEFLTNSSFIAARPLP